MILKNCNRSLKKPFLPSIAIQAKDRTTGLKRSGNTAITIKTALKRPAYLAIKNAHG
jgi:hypothetical protein